MASFAQEQRLLQITTPLGPNALLAERVTGAEGVSQLFSFALDLLAPKPVSFEQVLGQNVTVSVTSGDNPVRYFNGIISEFSQGNELTGAEGAATFIRYRGTLVPKFWLLTQRRQSCIYQTVSVPDILRTVLTSDWGLDVSFELTGSYSPRNYCVQYRESDFDFASRLMEEEGIAYYFQHKDGAHDGAVGQLARRAAGAGKPGGARLRSGGEARPRVFPGHVLGKSAAASPLPRHPARPLF